MHCRYSHFQTLFQRLFDECLAKFKTEKWQYLYSLFHYCKPNPYRQTSKNWDKIPGLFVASAPGNSICLCKTNHILGVLMACVRLIKGQHPPSVFMSTEGSLNSSSLPENTALCCPAPQWRRLRSELVAAGTVHRATTQCKTPWLSGIGSERTPRGYSLIWFVPLHGLSLTEGYSKNKNHSEANYFKA